jgi:hypothetical protein
MKKMKPIDFPPREGSAYAAFYVEHHANARLDMDDAMPLFCSLLNSYQQDIFP